MRTALDLQRAMFARSLTARFTTIVTVMFPPLFAVGMVVVARSGASTGPSGAKFEPYRAGPFADAAASLAGQVTTVAAFVAIGFSVAWLFGREWADGSIGSLFALPVSRAQIATAKVAVLSVWGALCVTLAVTVTAVATAVVAPEGLTASAVASFVRVEIAGLFMVALTLPFALVAVRSRGYLAATGAIVGITAASQILASLGVGTWVPYVAPALWAGAGGAEAAADVGPLPLLCTGAFAAIGTWAAIRAFATARLD